MENKPDPKEDQTQVDETETFSYDPTKAIKKAGLIQNIVMDSVLNLPADELIKNTKLFEQVNSLLSNVNSTAVAVTRNSIVESNSDLGLLADKVADSMIKRGVSLIRTVDEESAGAGKIPTGIEIVDAEFEVIEESMLQRGITHTTYDEFAEQNNMASEQQEL